jgi:class 3 adenylate cyclase
MVTSIFDSRVLTQACSGPGNSAGHEHNLIATGDISADKLVDDARTARGPRIAVTGTASDALSMSAQRKTIEDAFDATLIAAESIHAAVLFADMRGYTGLAERLPPARVVSILNEFFTILARVTVKFGGEVFHMAGDGMMAGFGVRDSKGSGVCAALAASHAMLQSFAPVAARWRDEFAVVTGIGIGLHSGEIALGFLGPPGKRAITMIGDTANVAARLCSRACAGEVLFSCAVAAALRADAGGVGVGAKAFLQLPQFELRGRSKLLDIWCVPAPEKLAH